MKNLLNCHSIGLHSFPISLKDGLYKRIFYAEENHNMWRPFEIAIHPHHVDIQISVLEGELYNPIYEISPKKGIYMNKYKWNSHILNGKGGFEDLGVEVLVRKSNKKYKSGDDVFMKACELHTVQIEKGKKCVWLIEESIPSCEYFPINYSIYDLSKWSPDELYVEVGDDVKEKYISKYLNLII